MAHRVFARLFHQVHGDGASDADLLDRFVANRDQAAFELLVWRHRHLVFGVCRRVLHDFHDAEDAFQATFLTLARKAGSIHKRQALASWLYQVAQRVALTARSRRARRSDREQALSTVAELPAPTAEGASEWRELWPALDEELGRLPERFRTAAILCYLEGKTVEEAAGHLVCPRGTVASRLARAREQLRSRLAKRGLTLSDGALAVLVAPRSSTADAFVHSTVRIVLQAAPRRVAALTQEVIHAMFIHKLIVHTSILLAFGACLLLGGGLALRVPSHAQADPPPAADKDRPETPPVRDAKAAPKPSRPVTVDRPIEREFTPYEEFVGRTEAQHAVEVRPRVAGVIVEIRVREGEAVKKGDVLFELDSRPLRAALDQATADLGQSIARRKQAEVELARLQKLATGKTVGREELVKAALDTEVAQAACKAAQSAVEVARLNLEATRIVAPIAGVVVRRFVQVGDLAAGGQATLLARIASRDPMGLKFEMDENSYLRYQRLLAAREVQGTGSPLYVALSNEREFPHRANLDRFGSQFSPERGTIDVFGSLPNPKGRLLAGQFVRVRMPFGKPRRVIEARGEAFFSDHGEVFAWVVGNRNVVEKRRVSLGQKDGELRVVLGGLTTADRVIIKGVDSVHAGDIVEPRGPTKR